MATQTRFDLNAAIENWRNELAAQLELSPDDRRELEKHLADSVTEMRERGLSEEESFWLARRRIGQPQLLAEEFVKADPTKIWRERAFWMVFGPLAFIFWASLLSCFWHRWDSGAFVLANYLPIIVLPILLARGHAVKIASAVPAVFKTRWHFAVITIAFIAATRGPQALEGYRFRIQMDGRLLTHTLNEFWLNQLSLIGFPLILIAMATWLMPTKKRQCRTKMPT